MLYIIYKNQKLYDVVVKLNIDITFCKNERVCVVLALQDGIYFNITLAKKERVELSLHTFCLPTLFGFSLSSLNNSPIQKRHFG
jgi:preprotein translocase subunit SecB